jgi:hypothetical protein
MKIDIATILAADILEINQIVAAVVHVEYRWHRHPLQSRSASSRGRAFHDRTAPTLLPNRESDGTSTIAFDVY